MSIVASYFIRNAVKDMKVAIAMLGGMAAGFFTFDLMWAVIREEFSWTTVGYIFEKLGFAHDVPNFAQLLMSMPAIALFLIPAILFYLLILWIDFS